MASQETNKKTELRMNISRPVYDHKHFEEDFVKEANPPKSVCNRVSQYAFDNLHCSKGCISSHVLSFFPFINTFRNYKWRNYIVKEILSGLSVGVIHIPQSMGFAIITGVPPVYGLYSSLFPILVYFLFGTSRHISIGTMAIISIMIGAIVERESVNFVPQLSQNATLEEVDEARVDFSVDIAASVTLLVGIIQFAMGFFRLGVLATFMSMSFIGGFMTGAAFHIVTSQIPFMLGIQIPRQVGVFRFLKTWYWIFKTIPETNVCDLVISIICVTFLLVMKEIVNDKLKGKLKVPIPCELMVVIIATMVSYLGKLDSKYDIRIIEDIPRGLPYPKIPTLHNSSTYIVESFAIAIVSYAVSMSLAKTFSHKHRYQINQNQELFAHGLVHGISACFSSFAGAAAPPRTLVHSSAGGKTQMASLVSALLILLVCLVLGPLFESLPNSALGCIIAVAVFPLFKQFCDLPMFWKLNHNDVYVWVLTFVAVIVLDVDYGLYVGIGFSLLTLIIQTHRGKGEILTEANSTELYLPKKSCKGTNSINQDYPSVAVFRFNSPLYFANIDVFKAQLFAKTINPTNDNNFDETQGLDSPALAGTIEICVGQSRPSSSANDHTILFDDNVPSTTNGTANGASNTSLKKETKVKDSIVKIETIVLDCSAISYIDIMGLNVFKQLISDYEKVNVKIVFALCSQSLVTKMKAKGIPVESDCFPSIHDAVVKSSNRNEA